MGPERAAWLADWSPSKSGESVVSRFDQEWAEFSEAGTSEQARIFEMYFDVVPDKVRRSGLVLDAGCGAGRWAVQMRAFADRVVALDAGRSVELAHANGRPWGIAGVQADIGSMPFGSKTFDFVYSLGVLHHVEATERGVAELVRVLRPGGSCLVYLYYALDGRGWLFRAAFRIVDILRRLLSSSPQGVVRAISLVIAAVLYLPLARASSGLRRLGFRRLANSLPLSAYADRSFRTMRNDSLDRFGTRLEKRFTRAEVVDLMMKAGLVSIDVADTAPFWHAIGHRPLEGTDST